jgi:hypothetical protein
VRDGVLLFTLLFAHYYLEGTHDILISKTGGHNMLWRVMSDPELGFLIEAKDANQAKQIITQRFKVTEFISAKPDAPADDKTAKPDPEMKRTFDEEIAPQFDKFEQKNNPQKRW